MINFIKVEENFKELADLASEIWHEYYKDIITLEQIDYMINKFQSEDAIKKQIEQDNYDYFLIQRDGVTIGYFGVSRKTGFLFLSKIYIKKEFRGLGFGHSTFLYALDYAKSLEYKNIILTVNKNNNNSIETYMRWGFKTIDSVVTEIGMGFVMDDFIMEYKI